MAPLGGGGDLCGSGAVSRNGVQGGGLDANWEGRAGADGSQVGTNYVAAQQAETSVCARAVSPGTSELAKPEHLKPERATVEQKVSPRCTRQG